MSPSVTGHTFDHVVSFVGAQRAVPSGIFLPWFIIVSSSPREQNEVGVHARRAGDIKGEHEVLMAGNEEVFRIKHRSESREVFASGSLDAAEWIQNQDSGFYSFDEVLQG